MPDAHRGEGVVTAAVRFCLNGDSLVGILQLYLRVRKRPAGCVLNQPGNGALVHLCMNGMGSCQRITQNGAGQQRRPTQTYKPFPDHHDPSTSPPNRVSSAGISRPDVYGRTDCETGYIRVSSTFRSFSQISVGRSTESVNAVSVDCLILRQLAYVRDPTTPASGSRPHRHEVILT